MNENEYEEILDMMISNINEYDNINKYYPNYRRVFIFGLTGSCKTSIAIALTKNLLIKKENNFYFTSFDHQKIRDDGDKVNIFIDNKNKLLLYDFPHTDDFLGQLSLIRILYQYKYYLSNIDNVQIKIILAINHSEFVTSRGRYVLRSIEILENIFTNLFDLIKNIGLIVTKGYPYPDYSNFEHLNHIIQNDPKQSNFLNYFSLNEKQVFIFPEAKKSNIAHLYDFRDRERLFKFLTNDDYILNPKIEIKIDDSQQYYTSIFVSEYFLKIKNKLIELLIEIITNCEELNNLSTIDILIKDFRQIIDQKKYKLADLHEIIKNNINIPNYQKYDKYFKEWEKFDKIHSFLVHINEQSDIYYRDIFESMIKELEALGYRTMKSTNC